MKALLRTCNDLCNLLGDGSLTGLIEFQAQIGDHLIGILGGGIHRRPAGSLLGSPAFTQRAVEHTSQIFRYDGRKDLLAACFIENLGSLTCRGIVLPQQRQQPA